MWNICAGSVFFFDSRLTLDIKTAKCKWLQLISEWANSTSVKSRQRKEQQSGECGPDDSQINTVSSRQQIELKQIRKQRESSLKYTDMREQASLKYYAVSNRDEVNKSFYAIIKVWNVQRSIFWCDSLIVGLLWSFPIRCLHAGCSHCKPFFPI